MAHLRPPQNRTVAVQPLHELSDASHSRLEAKMDEPIPKKPSNQPTEFSITLQQALTRSPNQLLGKPNSRTTHEYASQPKPHSGSRGRRHNNAYLRTYSCYRTSHARQFPWPGNTPSKSRRSRAVAEAVCFLDIFSRQPDAKPQGFGMHLHSGIATLTMLAGEVIYEDTTGKQGI